MVVEFNVGEKYRNRRGEYEVLNTTADGRLRVRYTADGTEADLDREQQARIIDNMQVEQAALALEAAKVKPVKKATRVASPKVAAPPRPVSAATIPPYTGPARPRQSLPSDGPVDLKPTTAIRTTFTKLEVLKLLQFIGFGNATGKFWFVGTNEVIAADDGNVTLSERIVTEDYQKEFADAEILKARFRTETSSAYGNPTWRNAAYLVTQLLAPQDQNQTEESRQQYFAERFGALDGEVLLTDILSLPAKSLNPAQWPYRNSTITDSPLYRDTLHDPERYLEDRLMGRQSRIDRLRELYEGLKLQKTAPQFVICSGRLSTWKYFKELFPAILNWAELELKIYSEKERTVRTALARDDENGTLVVLTPPFNPSEGVTYFYLDQLIAFLHRMKR